MDHRQSPIYTVSTISTSPLPYTTESLPSTPIASPILPTPSRSPTPLVFSPFELEHQQTLARIGQNGKIEERDLTMHVGAATQGTGPNSFLLNLLIVFIVSAFKHFFGYMGILFYFLFINGPITYSLARIRLAVVNNQAHINIEDLIEGFKPGNLTRAIEAQFLIIIHSCLWTLALILPGVLHLFSYSMTWYILVENPNITASEAMMKSEDMMDGYRSDYFYYNLPSIILKISVLTIVAIVYSPISLSLYPSLPQPLDQRRHIFFTIVGALLVSHLTPYSALSEAEFCNQLTAIRAHNGREDRDRGISFSDYRVSQNHTATH